MPGSTLPTLPRRTATLAVAGLLLVGCASAQDEPGPTSSPEPTSGSSIPVVDLAVVDPSLVAGLDTRVEEDFGPGLITFATVPEVPGAEGFTEEMQLVVTEDIARFRADTPPADEQPYPELNVGWDLVAASPEVLGVRVRTTELFATADDGRTATAWYDIAARTGRLAVDLVTDTGELADRVRAAAGEDGRIEPDLLSDELASGSAAFDAIAFTTDGDLFVEFDQGHVAKQSWGPVAVSVDPEGLLSELGEKARAAALTPSDPALVPVAAPTTRPTETPAAPIAPPPTSDVDCSVQQCVALTFDDGPVSGTADLLDVLAEKGARATFFVVGGNAAAQPDLLARMVAEGHVVGNHTQDHPDLSKLDPDSIRSEIEAVNDLVEGATGVRPTLLRPPYGATNDTVAEVATSLGMAQILWNVDPEDWKDRDSAIVQQRVLDATGAGDIVLSHDIHETTRDAYGAIIDGLRAEGYALVTVPELLGSLQPGERYFSR